MQRTVIGHDWQREILARLAESGALPGSYLFLGEPQVGKRAVAEELARSLEPGAETLSETIVLAADERGTIGIEAVRDAKVFLSRAPANARCRTVIIAGGEALTAQACEALLKAAEEPPPYGVIIVTSPSRDALSETLTSRLAILHFGPVEEIAIESWLIEERGVEASRAREIAGSCFGRPGLALELLEAPNLETAPLETPADYQFYCKHAMMRLFAKRGTELRRLRELLLRLRYMETYTTNRKLQLNAALWTH